MAISTAVSRIVDFHGRHGFVATVCRAVVAAKRAVFSGRSVLFYCDLATQIARSAGLPSFLKVERKKGPFELGSQDLQEMTSFWNPKLACRNINERFDRGASLWLVKSQDRLAGYGWTLQGRTMEPHYFSLGQDDVHFFDFYVFPKCRGREMNPLLVSHILQSLAAECRGRAFIEAAEWNQAQLASLNKTPFRRLGLARKLTFFRHTIVHWAETGTAKRKQQDELENASIAATRWKESNVPR